MLALLVALTLADAGSRPVITPGPPSVPSSGSCIGAYDRSQSAIVGRIMARQRDLDRNAALAAQCRSYSRSVYVFRRG